MKGTIFSAITLLLAISICLFTNSCGSDDENIVGKDDTNLAPTIFKKTIADEKLAIVEINPIKEYIVIENRDKKSVDMYKYILLDEAGHSYRFNEGFILVAGKKVTIHTYSGKDTDADLYLNRKAEIWNNDHDKAYLTKIVDEYSY